MRVRGVFTAMLVVGALGAGSAQAETTYVTSFGSASTTPANPYPLLEPSGVAVNDSTGDVYVADTGNNRIEEFDSDGNFVRMWGKDVNVSTGGDICPEAPGDTCEASPPFGSSAGDAAGWFSHPVGIAVDNSNGPAAGSVYVVDLSNNRIQRFTADGEFVLTWGKAVNKQTAGNLCTAVSGQTCQAGIKSTTQPTEDGVFSGWTTEQAHIGLQIATGPDGDVYVADMRVAEGFASDRIQRFDSGGNLVGGIYKPPGGFKVLGGQHASTPVVAENGDVYIANETAWNPCFGCFSYLVRYDASGFDPSGPLPAEFNRSYGTSRHVMRAVIDPTNGFLIGLGRDCNTINNVGNAEFGDATTHINEYQPDTSQEVDCSIPATVPGSPTPDVGGGMAMTTNPSHRLYIANREDDLVQIWQPPATEPPVVTAQAATEITATGARINTEIIGNLDETTFHIEYGTAGPCSSNPCASGPEADSIGSALTPRPSSDQLTGLQPDTSYYYRVVATNVAGTDAGPDRTFITFKLPQFDPSCSNNLVRQQTGAAYLLDCRAYELVSAEDQGGYDVASDLVPGQRPYGGYPHATDRVLYAIHNGGVPNTGKPTNRGPDPYLAVRDAANEHWTTKYVGIPADIGSAAPFSSTVAGGDESLGSFAFAGTEICDPCFGGEESGIPLRLPDGSLVQGMKGSLPVTDPTPAGEVRKPLSSDGSNLVFASKQAFVAGANENNTDVTIYNRDLATDVTTIVSRLPDEQVIQNGEDVAALDLSADGSRTLVGSLVSTDSEGNDYYHLYMHIGSADSTIDLTPGTTSGVLYAGMDEAGTKVYFTTPDPLVDDGDTSADMFLAEVGPSSASLSRVSTGVGAGDTDSCDPAGNSLNPEDWNAVPGAPTDCSVVAVGGAGGVTAESGAAYFLSPEELDGEGVDGAPNLFFAAVGNAPRFIATLESSASSPLLPPEHRFQRYFGSFENAEGVAVDPVTGSSYVLDNGFGFGAPGAYVQKFDSSAAVESGFGTAGKVDGTGSPSGPILSIGDGSAIGQPIGIPASIAVDTDPASPNYRDLYVPSTFGSVVLRFSPSGAYEATINAGFPSAVAVNPANGNVMVASLFGNISTFTPAGAPTSPTVSIPFFTPGDVAVDTTGKIYFTDTESTTVYDSSGVETGKLGGSPAFGVDVDPVDNHVYVSKGDHVQEYDAAGAQVGGLIGADVLHGSVGVATYAGRITVANNEDENAAQFTPPLTPPRRAYDSPLVVDAVSDAELRHTTDFQATPSGDHAVFPSTLPLTGFDSEGQYNVFRYDALDDEVDCISCNTTLAAPSQDASLASNGLSISDDGRVFFNTGEPLVLRDSNAKQDVYEWSDQVGTDGGVELISAGLGQFGSSLLTVTSDGHDAFFFTRDTLAKNDGNGTLVKVYTAREDGGFFVVPPPPQCKASDECHGPGSTAPPPPVLGTVPGGNGNVPATTKRPCKRGSVRRGSRCVKRSRKGKRRTGHRARKHRANDSTSAGGNR
jgi:DNA-binding beta-propeller fold protein YncE